MHDKVEPLKEEAADQSAMDASSTTEIQASIAVQAERTAAEERAALEIKSATTIQAGYRGHASRQQADCLSRACHLAV